MLDWKRERQLRRRNKEAVRELFIANVLDEEVAKEIVNGAKNTTKFAGNGTSRSFNRTTRFK